MFVVAIVAINASAAIVNIISERLQTKYGELTFLFYETSSTVSTTTPNVNTATTPPSGTGSTEILAGSSAYLWSTEFQKATSVSRGNWVLNFWALGLGLSGSATISIYVTNSAGTEVSTLVSGGSSGSIGLSKSEISDELSCSAATIPAGGYIEVVLTSALTSAMVLYWGSGQLTDFQVPETILS
jgi:hypothetical protein